MTILLVTLIAIVVGIKKQGGIESLPVETHYHTRAASGPGHHRWMSHHRGKVATNWNGVLSMRERWL